MQYGLSVRVMQAATVVRTFADRGIVVDTRQQYVRLGFGFNHSEADVARLIAACHMHA
jgi:selenocysteine lyase/cysteine desulfurase